MPRTIGQPQRSLWLGAGDAWTWVSELLTATAVWGAIGYGLDRWLGTWPALFAIGAVVGNATGVYIVFRRMRLMQERAVNGRGETGEPNR